MEKPKTFAIKGDEPTLKAIYHELLKIGYEEGEYTFENTINPYDIRININIINSCTNIMDFRNLFVNDKLRADKKVTFQLPEQFNEALDFAKEQLEHPYWQLNEFEDGVNYLVKWKRDNEIDTAIYKNGSFFTTESEFPFEYTEFSKIQKIEIPEDF